MIVPIALLGGYAAGAVVYGGLGYVVVGRARVKTSQYLGVVAGAAAWPVLAAWEFTRRLQDNGTRGARD